jgi:hypothetical protein
MAKVTDLNNEQLVKLYIQLRDRRSERKRTYEMEDEGDKGKQEKIEGILLKRFQDDGLESVRTASGTAYKTVRTSASVADPDAFFEFVLKNELYDLLEKRCSKTVVEQYKDAHQELPPGINYSESVALNVRRG